MIKKLSTQNVTNELKGSSVFFQPPTPSERSSGTPEKDNKPNPTTQAAEVIPPAGVLANRSNTKDSTQSRNRDSTQSRGREGTQQVNQDGVIAEHLEEVRKAVKQLGKELSTHRFTAEEKAALADIVYTYARQGVRTSENEITRIGVNWLLLDYRHNGANSVLARLVERLHG